MATTNNLVQLKSTLKAPSVEEQFKKMLGDRAPQFLTSIISVVSNNSLLQKADVNSIIMGAGVAASMNLPLLPALGYAALVPYNDKNGCYAQLQVEWKGYVELFIRSGLCQSIICETVYDGQLVKKNKFKGEYVFDEDAKKSDKIIGFMSYFRLTNGFEKTEYMTIDEVKAHAQRFSQTYRSGKGAWKDHFEEMCKKTCIRRLLTKWAPKSIEMQKMIEFDQSVVKGDINDFANAEAVYSDNQSKDNNVEEAVAEEIVTEQGEVVDAPSGEVLKHKEEPKKEEVDF